MNNTNQKSQTKIPFNLELFKQGHKAVTRDGRETVFDSDSKDEDYPVCARISMDGRCRLFTKDGKRYSYVKGLEENSDLLYMQDIPETTQPSPEPKIMKIKPKQTVLYQSIKAKLKPHDPEKWKEVKKNLKQVIKSDYSGYSFATKDLSQAFNWYESKQGNHYWNDVYVILHEIENNDKL